MEKSSIFIKIFFDPKTILNHPNGPKTKIECLLPAQIAHFCTKNPFFSIFATSRIFRFSRYRLTLGALSALKVEI